MRRTIIAILLVTAGLAGCIGGEDSPADGPGEEIEQTTNNSTLDLGSLPSGEPVPTELALEGCSLETGLFTLPTPVVEQMVPDGAQPTELAPGVGSLQISVTACTHAEDQPADQFSALVPIEPPEGVPEGNATQTLAGVGSFVEGERLLDIYDAWDLSGISPGEVSVETIQSAPVARAGHGHATTEGFSVDLYTAEPGQAQTSPASTVRIVDFQDGEPRSVMDVSWPEFEAMQGSATLKLDAGISQDPFELLVGNAGFQGLGQSSTGTFPLTISYTEV